jgi:cyclophilin family peptidyl-prolyl cis-trans isomerase
MSRRFFVPAGVLAAFLSILLVQRQLSAQETPAQADPAQETAAQKTAAQETAAQETAAQADPAPPAAEQGVAKEAAPDPQQARAAFEAKLTEWKETLKQLRTLKHEYQLADEAGRANLEQQWTATIARSNDLLPAVAEAAMNAYRAAPNEDRELTSFLMKLLQDYVANDRYEVAAVLGNALIDNQCDMPQIYREAGVANFAINNLDRTLEILNKAEATNSLSGDTRALRTAVEDYKGFWKQEQELRQKESAADDLPRVKLTTTKGDMVIELFENEAPETVGNFLSLVKKGFYDGLTFHRVLAGFMAQVGCPVGDGTGGPGYTIYDECGKPEARRHFRGSVSMAKTNAPNSGGSQFFICFRPAPDLNGKHTVFGRVIEGIEVLDKLQRRDPTAKDPPEPDKIIKAEVLRDRGHEYLPRKVE